MTDYVNITGLLAKASEALPVGQMVQTETFSLFEAMSAVEIGNPKMDATASGAEQPKTIDALIDEGLAPVDLTPDQVLAVMDRLLAMEATWCTGEPAMSGILAEADPCAVHGALHTCMRCMRHYVPCCGFNCSVSLTHAA